MLFITLSFSGCCLIINISITRKSSTLNRPIVNDACDAWMLAYFLRFCSVLRSAAATSTELFVATNYVLELYGIYHFGDFVAFG